MNRVARLALAGFLLVSAAFAAELRVVILELERMQCYGCVQTVTLALQKVPGVRQVAVDQERKTATVRFHAGKTTPEDLARATADAGFPSKLRK